MKYKSVRIGISAGIAAVSLFFILGNTGDPTQTQYQLAKIEQNTLLVRSIYSGKIEARNQVTVMSKFKGFATVVELAKEGSQIRTGDLVARFDSADLERELLKLEKEYALAESERESQLNAIIPLEVEELKMDLQKISEAAAAEKQYLKDSMALAQENVISMLEVEQQKAKVAQLDTEYRAVKNRLALTKKYLHPSMRQRANAQLHSARQALDLVRTQLENTSIYAPAGGLLVYKPLHISGEYRTLRIGDSLHANQPFMVIPDLEDLVLQAMIPESELSQVNAGQKVIVYPQAFPDLRLAGIVEQVGVIAESAPGQPKWQKYFSLTIALDDKDDRLRPGMSAVAHVISAQREEALLIPRRAITWNEDAAYTEVKTALQISSRKLSLGVANETHYEVLAGLSAGETVILK